MPIIFGYGEDALSLHALSTGFADILGQLGDDSDPARSSVFFRPSFGRKGPSMGARSAEFGEFDAIIGTPRAVYLGEAKWIYTGGDDVVLGDAQLRRHRIFRAYLEEHRVHPCYPWAKFYIRMEPMLQLIHPNLIPAPDGSVLARNLTYILQRLDQCGPKIVDVLMFWTLAEGDATPSTCGTFRIVTHLCASEDNSQFVRIPNQIDR
jgi:hypothetical protein